MNKRELINLNNFKSNIFQFKLKMNYQWSHFCGN